VCIYTGPKTSNTLLNGVYFSDSSPKQITLSGNGGNNYVNIRICSTKHEMVPHSLQHSQFERG
jgi:hypothetical protein